MADELAEAALPGNPWIDGHFWLVPPCDFRIASAAASFYNAYEAHELDSCWVMFFGVDYYPEQWVFPYGGTADDPEGAWERDAELMVKAGFNVVRMGTFPGPFANRRRGNTISGGCVA